MSATATPRVEIAEACGFLLDPPLGSARYRVAYGGRYGVKSWSFARALLLHGVQRPLRVLCGREYQTSIRESVHHLLQSQITQIGLDGWYTVRQTEIEGLNGTGFFFAGLHHNVSNIKSAEAVDVCWVEEAESVTDDSWETLIPTIRKEGSEIWVTFNPALPDDPTYQRFVLNPPHNAIVRKVTYRDNDWRTDAMNDEIETLRERDPDRYQHVYEGEPWTRSEALVLGGKVVVRDFTPGAGWEGPYYGGDWGFAADPSTLVRVWVSDQVLYVEYETGGASWDMDRTAAEFRAVLHHPGASIVADSARPETINEMRLRGLNVSGASKWPGSVQDGINHLRSYREIVVHPRCERTAREARLWRFKADKAGKVLPVLVDGNDHYWDAVRYAIGHRIQRRTWGVTTYQTA